MHLPHNIPLIIIMENYFVSNSPYKIVIATYPCVCLFDCVCVCVCVHFSWKGGYEIGIKITKAWIKLKQQQLFTMETEIL
jgi:hypothetical protein